MKLVQFVRFSIEAEVYCHALVIYYCTFVYVVSFTVECNKHFNGSANYESLLAVGGLRNIIYTDCSIGIVHVVRRIV
jgi:hypothetical protein